jgi:hypothetical protein
MSQPALFISRICVHVRFSGVPTDSGMTATPPDQLRCFSLGNASVNAVMCESSNWNITFPFFGLGILRMSSMATLIGLPTVFTIIRSPRTFFSFGFPLLAGVAEIDSGPAIEFLGSWLRRSIPLLLLLSMLYERAIPAVFVVFDEFVAFVVFVVWVGVVVVVFPLFSPRRTRDRFPWYGFFRSIVTLPLSALQRARFSSNPSTTSTREKGIFVGCGVGVSVVVAVPFVSVFVPTFGASLELGGVKCDSLDPLLSPDEPRILEQPASEVSRQFRVL